MYARGTLAPFLRLGEVGRVRALKRVTKHACDVAVLVTKRILIHTVEPLSTTVTALQKATISGGRSKH